MRHFRTTLFLLSLLAHWAEPWNGVPHNSYELKRLGGRNYTRNRRSSTRYSSGTATSFCKGFWLGLPTVERNTSKLLSDMRSTLLRSRVHVVLSHCNTEFKYLAKFLGGVQPATTTIISKCGVDPKPLPAGATVLRWGNVGGCDHSYAAWIAGVMTGSKSKIANNDIIFFLKDTQHIPLGSMRLQTLPEMLAAVRDMGFACGLAHIGSRKRNPISAYASSGILGNYHMTNYKGVIFRHQLTIAEWWKSLEIEQPPVVQLCYGGWFATTGARLRSRPQKFWAAMAQSLDYGEYSIPEGHYAERSWASLLRKPIKDTMVEKLNDSANITSCVSISAKKKRVRGVDQQNSMAIECGAYVNCDPSPYT